MNMDAHAVEVLQAALYRRNAALLERVTPELRFAHYTSAATARGIIPGEGDKRAFWLRNATEMNDFLEIEWGQSCLLNVIAEVGHILRPACARRA
jgi:hypothetical protein